MRLYHLAIKECPKKARAKAVKVIRSAFPQLELGPTLSVLKDGGEIISIETDSDEAQRLLQQIIDLHDDLALLKVVLSTDVNEGPPGPPSSRPRLPADRDSIVTALEVEKEVAFAGLTAEIHTFLNELNNSDWFAKVDLAKWPLATRQISNYENALLECENVLTATMAIKYHLHYNRSYRPLREALEGPVKSLVKDKLRKCPHKLPQKLESLITWLIGAAATQVYWSYLVEPTELLTWVDLLRKGQIPCGWDGDYPEGNLILI